jgi:protein ImuB
VDITPRRRITAPPDKVSLDGGPVQQVLDWAGPWFADAQWWGRPEAKGRVRLQLVMEGNIAVLLVREGGKNPLWTLEGIYD